MIICAAIKLVYRDYDESEQELIICGHRHSNCFEIIKKFDPLLNRVNNIQGFINHKGEFLDRKEALKHALECGQLNETTRWYQQDHNSDELYSEDLY
jgi:hypothetical protein